MSATFDLSTIDFNALTPAQKIELGKMLQSDGKQESLSEEQDAALTESAGIFNQLNKLTKQATDLARNKKADDLAVVMVEYYELQNRLTGGFSKTETNPNTGKAVYIKGLSSKGGFTTKRGREILESREG